MDIFEAIKERRSYRSFWPDSISEETIEKILEAAIWAPFSLKHPALGIYYNHNGRGERKKIF